MKKQFLTFIFLIGCMNTAFGKEVVRSSTCGVQSGDESAVYSSDFSWNMSLEQIKAKYNEIYKSGKRLKLRAWYDGANIVMPHKERGDEVMPVKLPEQFIKSVRAHVENAFRLKYVDALIFPDMGHSHLFIPHNVYDEVRRASGNQNWKFYELLFQRPELKVLYHTAEQLTMVDEDKKPLEDRETQWRFYTRNLVGNNQALGKMELLHEMESSHNTARNYDDKHRYYGAGFSISASIDGCFPFQVNGKTYYFDLSFYDLEPETTSGSGGGYF